MATAAGVRHCRVASWITLASTAAAASAVDLQQRGAAAYTSFQPGKEWLDTAGQPIRAHSGDVLIHGDVAYWYGSDSYPGGNATLNKKINVYTSPSGDLANWTPAGVAFDMPDHPNCTRPAPSGVPMTCYADRCHVLFNAATSTFVMWCKSKPFVSVATSTSPTGPFALKSLMLPGGHEVGDCTAFADPQRPSDAVFVLSVHPSSYGFSKDDVRQVKIFPLTPSWDALAEPVAPVNATPPWPLPNKYDGKLEAPALFYDAQRSRYSLWASHCTYWWPNDAYLLTSPSLQSTRFWTPRGNPTHNDTSFGTQSTAILLTPPAARRGGGSDGGVGSSDSGGSRVSRVGSGASGRARDKDGVPVVKAEWIYVSDRFEPYINEGSTGRYVWLPVERDAQGDVVVRWYDEWRLG